MFNLLEILDIILVSSEILNIGIICDFFDINYDTLKEHAFSICYDNYAHIALGFIQ